MYELAGKVAEERGLEEAGSLKELLEEFKKRETIFSSDVLPSIEDHVEQEIRREQTNFRDNMIRILSSAYLPSERRNIEQALDHLVMQYILTSFEGRYDEISPDLFELKRVIDYPAEDNTLELEIPLFAELELGGKGVWTHETKIRKDYKTHEIKIKSNLPPVTREAKEKARQAQAHFLEIYAATLKEPVVGDWLLGEGTNHNFNLIAYWIPLSSELKIEVETIDRDPIIIANLYDRKFLIARWDVEGERPFEHYLREYKV